MNISIKPEHEQFIQSQIQAGRYANAEEVMNEAFKLYKHENNVWKNFGKK